MSLKSNSTSGSDSSPEEGSLYLAPSFIRERDEKGWRTYLSNAELMTTASAIFSHMNNTDDSVAGVGVNSNSQVSFLYDYYGMTEETRQDPPSPGHSSGEHSNDAKDMVAHSSALEVSSRPDSRTEEMADIKHSFPENGKVYPFIPDQESQPFLKKSLPSAIAAAKEKTLSSQSSSSSPVVSNTEPQMAQKEFFFPRPPFMDEKYIFVLEAQTSVVQKRGEDSLTYLNKGQFYYVSFEAKPSKLTKVKSIIHLVFGHQKDIGTELSHWRYWYNQQPNPNQRAFDIDLKVCQNIDEEIEEVGYNALAFTWDPNNRAKISIRINCLSTDFSAQKGVKGIPLHLQIDTYEDFGKNADPVHRGLCQIKVFRDKGAERKNKDESKLVGKKMVKFMKGTETQPSHVNTMFQVANKVTVFYSVSAVTRKPVVFIPSPKERTKSSDIGEPMSPGPASPAENLFVQLRDRENKRAFQSSLTNAKEDLENLDVYPRLKNAKVVRRKEPAVTIYVRKEEEKAYNALMLDVLSLEELKLGIASKYGVPCDMIRHVLKKTKKGILVNLDDQLVERFVDEDDFIVTINFDNQMGSFEVIFS